MRLSETDAYVTCIGGANVDRKIQSLAPLQLGTSNPASVTETHGGVARNIAENLGRLGARPRLVTLVGDDAPGNQLLAACRNAGIDVTNAIQTNEWNTGTYTAVLDVNGEMTVALADMALYDALSIDSIAARWDVIASSRLLIIDTNPPAETLAYILQRAYQEQLPVCVTPVSSPKVKRLPADLRGVWLLVANLDELAALTNRDRVETEQEIAAAAAACMARGCERVVVTMGQRGCCYFQKDGRPGQIQAEPVSVVDVTGAGDAFVAGVTYALAAGPDLAAACAFGTRCSRAALATKETVSHDINPEVGKLWLDEIAKEHP